MKGSGPSKPYGFEGPKGCLERLGDTFPELKPRVRSQVRLHVSRCETEALEHTRPVRSRCCPFEVDPTIPWTDRWTCASECLRMLVIYFFPCRRLFNQAGFVGSSLRVMPCYAYAGDCPSA